MPVVRQHGGGRWYGDSIHPRPSRMHLREAWNLVNSLGYLTGMGREGIEEVQDLTMSHQVGSATFEEASRGRVDDGGDGWREREGTGEDESEEIVTKT